MTHDDLVIAAIVPCHNEAPAIHKVVTDLKAAVPGIHVYVYDNNSTDGTDEVAAARGPRSGTSTPRARATSSAVRSATSTRTST